MTNVQQLKLFNIISLAEKMVNDFPDIYLSDVEDIKNLAEEIYKLGYNER